MRIPAVLGADLGGAGAGRWEAFAKVHCGPSCWAEFGEMLALGAAAAASDEDRVVWLKAAAAGSGVLREQAIATALRLTRRHEAVEAVVEGEPSTFGVILDEFTTVQD